MYGNANTLAPPVARKQIEYQSVEGGAQKPQSKIISSISFQPRISPAKPV
jgi:hypothetical protein